MSVCNHLNVSTQPYDFGICQETGYPDAGDTITCRDCGEDVDEEYAGTVSLYAALCDLEQVAEQLVLAVDPDSPIARQAVAALLQSRAARRAA